MRCESSPKIVTEFGCCTYQGAGARGGMGRDDDPTRDTDLASYGVVAMLPPSVGSIRYPDMRWEPKAVFDSMAQLYGQGAAGLASLDATFDTS